MESGPTPGACVSDSKARVPSAVSLLTSVVCPPWRFRLSEHKGHWGAGGREDPGQGVCVGEWWVLCQLCPQRWEALLGGEGCLSERHTEEGAGGQTSKGAAGGVRMAKPSCPDRDLPGSGGSDCVPFPGAPL